MRPRQSEGDISALEVGQRHKGSATARPHNMAATEHMQAEPGCLPPGVAITLLMAIMARHGDPSSSSRWLVLIVLDHRGHGDRESGVLPSMACSHAHTHTKHQAPRGQHQGPLLLFAGGEALGLF